MERKVLALADPTLTDDGAGSFSGYASLFGVLDSQGDIVQPGAYADTLPQFLERGFIAWGHDWSDPVATVREAREDERGLFLVADFHSDPDSQRARVRTAERLHRGKFMGLSIGYLPLEVDFREDARLLKKIELFETSLVTVPALRDAGVTSAKAAEPYDGKPLPNEHACRLRDPDAFQPDSFRRMTRRHEGKEYSVIVGRLRGETTTTEQAYRYPKDTWTAAEARAHCRDHEGRFEAAKADDGATYAHHAEHMLADVQAFITRSQSLADLRAKEGRVLSTANRDRLAGVRTQLAEAIDALEAVLQATAPRNETDKAALAAAVQRERLRYERLRARALGVAV